MRRVRRLASEYLGLLAKLRVPRAYSQIVGVTGSLGKSCTKEAIVHVLRTEHSVDQSTPEYNTRLGLLWSIFQQAPGEGSPKAWLRAMAGATGDFLTERPRSDWLVLEMGASAPGGMTESLRTFRPDISVFTGVAPAHLADGQFEDEPAIFDEKSQLVRTMKHGTAILNRDNEYCRRLENEYLTADLLWYGRLPENQPLDSLPPGLYFDQLSSSADGIAANVHLSGAREPRTSSHGLTCPVIGEHHIYILLPAILTGLLAGLDLERSCRSLRMFSLPPGRMTLIPGINSCAILDSSRNASPKAVEAALETLRDYQSERRIALLGSAQELGAATESMHRAMGEMVSRCAQMLITVGEEARLIAEGARTHGMPEHSIRSFDTPEEAGLYLRDTVRPGDVLLAKGSRRVNLERAIELFMRDPDQAEQLLFQQ